MTESNKDASQEGQFDDECLLEELQQPKSMTIHTVGTGIGEKQGSLLLDSINAYLHNSQENIHVINEAEEYEQEFQSSAKEKPNRREQSCSGEIMRKDLDCQNNDFDHFQPLELSPKQQDSNRTHFLKSNSPKRQPISLEISHYKSSISQSLGKKEVNSSLVVEMSNGMHSEPQNEEARSEFKAASQTIVDSNHLRNGRVLEVQENFNFDRNVERMSESSFHTKDLIRQLIMEEDKQVQTISNHSIDSTRLIALVPLDYLTQDKCAISQYIEQPEKKSKFEQKKQAEIEYMELEHIPATKYQGTPMQIEGNPIHNLSVPMQIESIEFTHDFPHKQTFIDDRYDPIPQPNQQQDEQIVEQQEVLDNKSVKSIIEHLTEQENDKYKEFTFGKVEVQCNPYDNINLNEEMQKNMEIYAQEALLERKDCNYQVIVTNVQREINYVANLSNENSFLDEQAQNLSLHVEHDNNFSAVLQQFEEIPVTSLKNQANDYQTINDPILTNLTDAINEIPQENSHPIIIEVNNSHEVNDIKYDTARVEFNENTQQISMLREKETCISDPYENQDVIDINSLTNIQEIKSRDNMLHQEISVHELHSQEERYRKPNEKVYSIKQNSHISEKQLKSIRKNLSLNHVCQYALGNQVKVQQNSHQILQNSNEDSRRPQIIIHNDNYHITSNQKSLQSSSLPYHPPQPHFLGNHMTSQAFCQPNIQSYPCINVNFKNNEMSVSIVGPALHYKSSDTQRKGEEVREVTKNKVENLITQSITSNNNQQISRSFLDSSIEEKPSIEQAHQVNEKKAQKQPPHQRELVNESNQPLEKQSSRTIQEQAYESFLKKYNFVISESENYLLVFTSASEAIHKEFEKLVNQNVFLRFAPEPKDELGLQLFKNGLFLISLVKLISRSSQTPFLINYIFEFLENAYGNTIERNSYVFKSECQKAKKCYEAAIEKKHFEILSSHVQAKDEPVKRKTIGQNPFLPVKSQKKDSWNQTTPQQQVIPEIKERLPQRIEPIVEKKQIVSQHSSKKIELERSRSELQSSNAKKSLEKIFQKPQLPQNISSPLQSKEEKKKTDTIFDSINQDSSRNEKRSQLQIKKSIQEIKTNFGAFGSINKKDTQDSNSGAGTKFTQLYQKYRKIRENKKSDLPLENSSVKRNIIDQALKNDKEEYIPEKKPTKKVAFPDEVTKEQAELDDSFDDDQAKKKKKKKSRSKRDTSVDSNQQQYSIIKKRTNSKK